MTETELKNYIAAIRPADRDAMAAARQRQAQLAKPPGSLGALEDMSVRLAGVTGQVCPRMDKCRVAVFAADNGVVDEGVSCAPRSVTVQQAVNMTRRKTGMSAMAAAFGDDVAVVDVGMDCGTTPAGILNRRVRRSTGDIAIEDAMTRPQVLAAMAVGMEQAALAKADSVTALGIGEMGIGNTSTSAAVLAVLTGADIETVTGRGGGLTDRAFARKKDVLRTSIGRRPIRRDDAVDVLCAVGGLDIAAMTGAFLGCAHEGIPAAVDGFISVTAALCAVTLCPAVRDYLMELQRSLAREHSVIMDGRDIGTVVLPDADVKVFLCADVAVRARRRCLELEKRGTPKPYDQVLKEMEERDYQDTHRAIAPLRPADDAIMIDNTDMDFEASCDLLVDVIRGSVER